MRPLALTRSLLQAQVQRTSRSQQRAHFQRLQGLKRLRINGLQSVTTITSSATPTVNTDNCDAVTITALATAITSMTTNLSGTPTNFQPLIFRIKDDGQLGLLHGDLVLLQWCRPPTTTVISKILTVGFIYDTVLSKWACIASAQEA